LSYVNDLKDIFLLNTFQFSIKMLVNQIQARDRELLPGLYRENAAEYIDGDAK